MLKRLPHGLKGSLVMAFIILSTMIHFPVFLVGGVLKFLLPLRPFQVVLARILEQSAWSWIRVNGWLLDAFNAPEIHVSGLDNLNREGWYLVTCNHQTWSDILIVQKILAGKAPFLKFFLKQELIWVPLIGIGWWALDFPFMKRYSRAEIEKNPALKGKDLETTRKACEKFKHIPVSVFNFMEGTRFTPEKHAKQQSPYQHLLKPKAGGAAFVLGAMGEELDTMINLTIYYPYTVPGFWNFINGRIREVHVVAEVAPIPARYRNRDYANDEQYRNEFQQWVGELWSEKDALLEQLGKDHKKRQL